MNNILRVKGSILLALGSTSLIIFQILPSIFILPGLASETSSPKKVVQTPDFGRHFRELGVEGSILIYDSNHRQTFQYNPQRNKTAFLPASTFKILNSLIALETGVIANETTTLKWDGIQRKEPKWNRDLTMKEAFTLSAYWFYQILARRIEYERMQKWVAQVGYGNRNIGSKADIDKFWLRGKLRITPQEQIQFLQRFYRNDLPFQERSLAIVKNMMIVEKTPNYTISGKTGWVGFDDGVKPQIGWWVGYIEKGKDVYFFTTNIEIHSEKDASARKEITRRCFKDLSVL